MNLAVKVIIALPLCLLLIAVALFLLWAAVWVAINRPEYAWPIGIVVTAWVAGFSALNDLSEPPK